jgi:hypothetical protein
MKAGETYPRQTTFLEFRGSATVADYRDKGHGRSLKERQRDQDPVPTLDEEVCERIEIHLDSF